MKTEEIQNLKIGEKIYWNFYMKGMGTGFKNHIFTIVKIDLLEKPKIESPYWTNKPNFGPARKLTIEDHETKKKFYLIIPVDYVSEKYIYFTNDEDLPGDKLEPEQITLFRKP